MHLSFLRRCWAFLWEFTWKQAWACVFAGAILAAVLATHWWWPAGGLFGSIARYDALFVFALLLQALLLISGLESRREAVVIAVFHGLAMIMEWYKTLPAIGSWSYPEPSVLRIGGVPLFVGFMYSAVGSYIARAWRVLDLRLSHAPDLRLALVIALAAYVNFFSHHVIIDLRWPLIIAVIWIFRRTVIAFTIGGRDWHMPAPIGLLLVASFIFIAENLATYARIWVYPHQHAGWRPVGFGKLSAWFLLMYLSFVLVWWLHGRTPDHAAKTATHPNSEPPDQGR